MVPEIGSRSFIGRNSENTFEVEARACDSRDPFVDDRETEQIPVFQVPVDLDLKNIRETIQSGSGRRHLERGGKRIISILRDNRQRDQDIPIPNFRGQVRGRKERAKRRKGEWVRSAASPKRRRRRRRLTKMIT